MGSSRPTLSPISYPTDFSHKYLSPKCDYAQDGNLHSTNPPTKWLRITWQDGYKGLAMSLCHFMKFYWAYQPQ